MIMPRQVEILLCGLLYWTAATSVKAQQQATNPDSTYRVEAHVEFGPLFSHYINGRSLPEGANQNVIGYNSMLELMWHPNHLLAVGILTGYQLLVAEKYYVSDAASSQPIQGSIHAIPLMIDETMQSDHLEIGVALGGYVIMTRLDDATIANASRFELGMIGHASYHWYLQDDLTLGPEILISYMTYRGIISFAPQLELRYVPLQY